MYSLFTVSIYVFAFLIIYAQLASIEPFGIQDKKGRMGKSAVVTLALFAFLLRLVAAPYTGAHPTDMKCWSYWGHRLYTVGPWNFYADGIFADYPPGYMYILWLIGSLVGVFSPSPAATLVLYKLPAIIGDIFLAFVIYDIARKHTNQKLAAVLFFLAAFNPLTYFNSVIWGQMDSLLVLFTLMSLYALYREKYTKSAIFIVIAVLLKPQALMFAPIYLFVFISKKDIKLIGKTLLLFLGIIIVASYPFSPALQGSENIFLRLLKGLNPLWLIEKYSSTLGSYDYASVNAFNFPALLGGNWKDASTPFLFLPWKFWGFFTIAFAIAFSGILYFKIKDKSGKIFVPAYFIITFLFAFGTKMHERYIYPSVIFLLILYIFSKNRHFLWLFVCESAVNLINTEYVFRCALNNNSAPAQTYITLIALIQLGIILASFYIIYHTYLKKSNNSVKNNKTLLSLDLNEKTDGITRKDLGLIGIITILYSFIAFSNLGDKSAPQTFTEPSRESFTIELASETYIEDIAYYYGISDTYATQTLSVSYSSNGTDWTKLKQDCPLKSVFKWDFTPLNETAKYIRFTPNTAYFRLGEIALIDSTQNAAKIKFAYYDSGETLTEILDEQELVPSQSTYKNGTYFDEIYHPRSAYELLTETGYYETTHPPLGKIIISLGISLFNMTPFGWRFTGTLFGVLMLPLLYLILKKLFKNTTLSAMGTLLFASDFMHYSLTRMGTIDSYPVFFILLMYLSMYIFTQNLRYNIENKTKEKRIFLPLLVCGIATGMGIASKWIAVYAVVGIALWFFIDFFACAKILKSDSKEVKNIIAKLLPVCILCFIILPFAIYLLSYIPVARCQNKGLWEAMADSQKYMLAYHSTLISTHPYSSVWYEWPIMKTPLLAYYETFGNSFHGAITIMGNPILWWSGILAFFYSIFRGIRNKDRVVLFMVIGLLSQLLPWVFVTRCTFIYHFFASVPFMIMLIVYSAKELIKHTPKFIYLVAVFCVLCIVSFILFYPVLTGSKVSDAYVKNILNWFNCWIF